jgi:pimeloyl-ACP methyl ester carboxylesterase
MLDTLSGEGKIMAANASENTKTVKVEVDGEKITGTLHSAGDDSNACVISCHGMLASKDSPKYVLLGHELVKKGISSIRFDFRGCGESGGLLERSHITNRLADLDAVVEYATNDLGFKILGLFGSSMGGFVSFIKAGNDPRVKSLVSLSSPYSMSELFYAKDLIDEQYEIDGIVFGSEFLQDIKANGTLSKENLAALKCPTLIFHGTADILVPTEHARRLFDSLATEKMLKIIPGGDHIFSHPQHLHQIIIESISWFEKYLNNP